MNHTYRLVWNDFSNMFVAVSELARSRGKSHRVKPSGGHSTRKGSVRCFRLSLRTAIVAAALLQMNPASAHTDSLGWLITPDANTMGTSVVSIFYGSWHSGNNAAEGSIVLTGPNSFSATRAFTLVPNFSNVANGVLPTGLTLGQNYFFPNTATAAADFSSSAAGHNIYAFQQTTFTGLGSGLYNFGYAAGPLTAVWRPSDPAINAGSFTINANGTISVIGASPATPVNNTIDTANGNVSTSVHDLASNAYSHSTLIFDGGTLRYGADAVTSKDAVVNAPGALIDTNDHAATITGTISGNGALTKTGAGTLVLSAVNTFQGGVTVTAGTVQVNADANLGDAAGGITLNGGTLQTTGSFATGRDTTLTGSGTFNTDANTILTSNGAVSGNGSLVKAGDGTMIANGVLAHAGTTTVEAGRLILNGANSYAGGTVVNNGATIAVSADANLGNAAGGIALNGGTLEATGSFGTNRNITLRGVNTVSTTDNAVLTSNGTTSGSGALVKNGNGTVVLNGTASHSGGTTVNAGTLTLSGANTYSGGTTINGGTLKVSSDANLGDLSNAIVLNGGALQATASFNTSRNMAFLSDSRISTDEGASLVANGSLSGAGRLSKTGAGTLVLNGDNINWTGGTTIDGGLVQVNSLTGIGTGDVILNGGTIQTTVTLTTGQTINVGGNTGINTQANTTTTLTGALQNTAAAGDGCFIKSGEGTLDMKGNATLRNGTCVQQGMLRANGLLDSFVHVDQAGTLRGTGTIVGPTTVYGIMAPGNSPGTLTSMATVTMLPGSIFQADINGLGTNAGPGNYSRLLITGASSQFIAGGATLRPNLTAITGVDTYTPYVPQLGDRFRIVTAEGGIVGRFAPLAQPDGLAAGTRMAAYYNVFGSNSIDLAIFPASYAAYVRGTNANRNAQSAGAVLDAAADANQLGTDNTTQSQLLALLSSLNGSQMQAMTTALAGEIHGALAAAAPQGGQTLQNTVAGQLGGAYFKDVNDPARDQALWADLTGSRARWSADKVASGFTANHTQLSIGADILRTAGSRVGVGVSHSTTNVSAAGGSGSVEENMAFVYGEHSIGGLVLDGLAAYGRSSWDSRRGDPLGLAGTLGNSVHGNSALVSAGISLPHQVNNMLLAPYARLMWQQTKRDGFAENSATPAALTLSDYSAAGTRAIAGVMAGSLDKNPLIADYTYRYGAAVGVDGGNLIRASADATLASNKTTIGATDVGRAFVQINLNGTARMGKNAYSFIGLTGEAHSGKTDVGINIGARAVF